MKNCRTDRINKVWHGCRRGHRRRRRHTFGWREPTVNLDVPPPPKGGGDIISTILMTYSKDMAYFVWKKSSQRWAESLPFMIDRAVYHGDSHGNRERLCADKDRWQMSSLHFTHRLISIIGGRWGAVTTMMHLNGKQGPAKIAWWIKNILNIYIDLVYLS